MLSILLFLPVVCGVPQTVPETIYLPYSETEDVDFTIDKPGRVGCYQWSCENEEMIELIPVHTDYTLMCGSRLEIKILPGTGDPQRPVTLTILAENVNMEDYEEATASVTFTVVVVPVHKLEVLGVKTELKVGDEASPFGVAAFDRDNNEFDSLDGVQLAWFVGGRRDVVKFKDTAMGPVVNMIPVGVGKAQLVCMISDPNYSSLEPGILAFSVSAPLHLVPDGAYLLPGGEASLALFESVGSKEEPKFNSLDITGDLAEFSVSSREVDVARVDTDRSVVVAGAQQDETSLLVKDLEGNIVKGVPVRVVNPSRMEMVAHPHPESKQLIVGREYDINITIYDSEDHVIYPSENILMKTTFGKQFDIVDISMNGLWARVKAVMVGIGKIKASLRSTLTPDDEETELIPHVKAVTEFEIYEEVLMSPRRTVLPWDSNIQPEYQLTYKVSGGGKVYGYKVEPESMATVDTDGKVTVSQGPGVLTVTAGMSQSMHNNHTAKVLLLAPILLELPESMGEWMTRNVILIPVNLYGRDPATKEKVLFSDCSDVPLTVTLSNTKDFTYEGRSERGQSGPHGCISLSLKGDTPGATTKVTVTLTTEDGQQLTRHRYISTYEQLQVMQPTTRESTPQSDPITVLPVGGSRSVLYRGGPHPWPGKPSFFFSDVEVEDDSVVTASVLPDISLPYHGVTVSCLKLGKSKVDFGVGNKVSSTNLKPGFQRKGVTVYCAEPSRISKVEVRAANQGEGVKEPRANPSTGRVYTYSYRDFQIVPTIKDKEGRTMDNVTSLHIDYMLLRPELADQGPINRIQGVASEVPGVILPTRGGQVFHPTGRRGDLDIQVSIVGYKPEVLQSVGAVEPRQLPTPPMLLGGAEDDYDDYDYDDNGEPVLPEKGLAEVVSLYLASDSEIEALYD